MSLPAAASGFVVLLLCVPVVQGQDDWGVTFTSTQICAVKGSTVEMSCNYKHPTYMDGYYYYLTVQKTFWFIKDSVDLTTDEAYTDRVEYRCDGKRCTLRIRDLRKSDSAVYRFRFMTNPPEGSYSSPTGVTLSVTDLHAYVSYSSSSWKTLTCHNDCLLPDHSTYVWYKNGRDIGIATPSYSDFQNRDSVSCALRGFEDFPSASLCVRDQSCNKVNYNYRRICAVRGSTVVISCTYQRYGSTTSSFWFSPQQSHRWLNSSKPEDISKDSQYVSRVQVYEQRGYSRLTIRDLRETDSAEYRFKFKTSWVEWGSDLHGTTLTVTVLQVHVTRISDSQSYTRLQLKCLSSCTPSGHSYVWFKNGWKMNVVTFSFEDQFDLGDRISCALKRHEQHRSPEVYAPKLPSVSVSPSAEIMEGSSVTLTCSSDANPAANYTWYKENEDSPKASGQNFSIINATSKHSGKYYCEVRNNRGQRNSSLDLIIVSGPLKSAAVGSITVIVLVIIFLSAFLLIRRQCSLKKTSESRENPDNTAQQDVDPQYDNPSTVMKRAPAEQQDDLNYSSVHFFKKQEDPLYSNIMLARPNKPKEEEEEYVEYTAVNFNNGSPGRSRQEAVENPSAVYSTVNKNHRL